MNLVFDLDDTLLDFTTHATEDCNAATGKTLCDTHGNNYGAHWGMCDTELCAVWSAARTLERARWHGCQTEWNHCVRRWHAEGHRIVYATARGWHPAGAAITRLQLDAAGATPYTLVVTRPGECKTAALRARGTRAHIMVEDNLTHANAATRDGASVVIRTQRWNEHAVGRPRANSTRTIALAVDTMLCAAQDRMHATPPPWQTAP